MFRDQPLYQDSLASRHHCHNILITRLQGLSSISPQVFSLNRVHGLYLKHLLNLGWIHLQDTIMTGMPGNMLYPILPGLKSLYIWPPSLGASYILQMTHLPF